MKILNGNKQTNEYVDYVLTSVQHELVGFIIVLTGNFKTNKEINRKLPHYNNIKEYWEYG